jgi:hypothetical protein
MWLFKYLECLFKNHNWIGSHDRYCLRCGKFEIAHDHTLENANLVQEPIETTQTRWVPVN